VIAAASAVLVEPLELQKIIEMELSDPPEFIQR